MYTILMLNQKGGVGKTTIADELSFALERRGKTVAFVTTDPQGGFFLWLPVPDGEEAARILWARAGVQVLPGAYLSREVDGHNPGRGFIRVALVADAEQTESALTRLRAVLYDETTGGEG